jgi:hypothetical protein
MKRLFLLCLLVALPIQAFAQPRQVVTGCGGQTLVSGDSNNGYISTTGVDCGGGATTPPAILGFGTLAVVNASALASTATAGPNSAVWPTAPGMLYVLNDAASNGNLYVCPLGGTCSATVGLELTPGRSWGFFKPATAMTVFATTTATGQFTW